MPADGDFEPIRITEIITAEIGTPRGDGTAGSGLYRVPFRLSRAPTRKWAAVFIEAWNHPPRFTTMHRPGIASIVGDKVILDGTTREEVDKYHKDTLILAADEANKKYVQLLEQQKAAEEREAKRIEEHRRNVEEKAKRIDFHKD